jgi:hypothetical protein
MDNEIEELLILEEKVKNIKKRIRERKKSKTITIDGEAHETIKNHCASLNVNIGEWVSKTLLDAVGTYKEEINCLITDEIDFYDFEESEKKRILSKYSKKNVFRHLFKSNKMIFSDSMKFVGHSSDDNLPIYEYIGDNPIDFKLGLIKQMQFKEGLDITCVLETEITKGWMTEDMDCVVLSNKDVDLYETPDIIIT